MKEEIANRKIISMLEMLEQIGLDEVKYFNHRSAGSDGASVMIGKNNGVAARLKRNANSKILNIHCICHRLALACTDTLGDISYIKHVQLWLLQQWRLFENSPKKLAVYLKTQLQMKSVMLSSEKSREKAAKRLKKA